MPSLTQYLMYLKAFQTILLLLSSQMIHISKTTYSAILSMELNTLVFVLALLVRLKTIGLDPQEIHVELESELIMPSNTLGHIIVK